MIEILKAILFGIVEGITEWLPISSTGHMILLNEFVTLDVSEEFWSMFEVVIQLGAILAVVVLYWNKIFPFYLGEKAKEHHGYVRKNVFILWFKILVACIPAAIVGLLFDDVIDKYLYNPWVVAIMLIVFGVLFIVVENYNKNVIIKELPPRNWKQKGGEPIGNILIIFALHCGKCNSLLHMQMVRWRQPRQLAYRMHNRKM